MQVGENDVYKHDEYARGVVIFDTKIPTGSGW